MCRVWLWVSVFLQACVVLWSLNILCVVYFRVLCICMDGYMHALYIPDMRRADVTSVGQPLFKYQDDARSNTHKLFLHLTFSAEAYRMCVGV